MTDSGSKRRARGGVIRAADVAPTMGIEGHPGTAAHKLMRPGTEDSRWLHVTYNVIEHGGGIDPHYHTGIDADHAYFVISGTARARIGDEHHDVGPGDLMVFACDTVHGFTVTSDDGARVLRLGAAADGRTNGGSVFVDPP
jgi:quercetin dioxygenase-like cupin family protein